MSTPEPKEPVYIPYPVYPYPNYPWITYTSTVSVEKELMNKYTITC